MDTPIIAPFLADADTSGAGSVWYSTAADKDSPAGQAVAEKVALYFNDYDFTPETVVTVTWDRIGYFPMQLDKVNTFQCIMATNGSSSYVIFLYLDDGINWYQANERDGVPAQVGFNKGCGEVSSSDSSGDLDVYGSGFVMCGTYQVLEESMTNDVVDVEELSNIPGATPGFYMWRVSSDEILDGSSSCNNKGKYNNYDTKSCFYYHFTSHNCNCRY